MSGPSGDAPPPPPPSHGDRTPPPGPERTPPPAPGPVHPPPDHRPPAAPVMGTEPGQGAPSSPRGWLTNPAFLGIVGASVLGVIGAMLPWATAENALASASKNGLEGDGSITLVLFLIVAGLGVIGVMRRSRGFLIGALIAALLIVVIAIYDISDINNVAGEAAAVVKLDVGFGLWVTLIAGILASASAVLGIIFARSRR